ncbi:hypothetical protein AB6A40_004172 [Gnathostoma spinigerum]|uniref:Uncharacterized protein n=1 Tax=Gnathostoma spinigerum TaxID=75299 RepID=A0ABD6EBW2_9BILA
MGNDESTGGGVRSEVETKASENVRNREEAEGHGYDQFSSNGKCSTEGSDTSKVDSTLCVQSDAVVDAGVQSTCGVQIRNIDSSKNAENVGRKEEPSPGTAVAESEHKAVDGDSEEGIALPYDGDCDSKLAVLKSPYDIPPEMAVGDKTVTKCIDPICVEENAAKKHLDVLNEAKSSVQSNPFVSGDTDDGKLPATCDSTVSETSGTEENSCSDKAAVDQCLEGYKENETDIVGICNKGSAESSSEATVIHSSSPMSDPCNMKSMPYPDAKRRSSGVTEEDSSVAASALVPPPLEVIAGGSAAPYSSKVEQDSGSSTKRDNIGDANSAEGRQMITTSPIYQTPGSGKCTAEEFEAVEGVETKHESDTSGSPQQEVPNQRTSLPTDQAQITDITSNSLPEASKSERNTDVNSSPYFPEDFHCGKDPDTSSQYSNRSLSQFAFDSASIGSCPTEKSGSDSETSREMTPDSLVSGENKAKKLRKEHKARKLVLNNAASNIVSHFSIGHKIDSMFGSKKGKEKDGISIKSNGRSTSSFFSAADSISLSSRVFQMRRPGSLRFSQVPLLSEDFLRNAHIRMNCFVLCFAVDRIFPLERYMGFTVIE